MIDFSLKLNAGIITYPYLNLPVSTYKDFVKNRNRRNENYSTLFTLDMRMPPRDFNELIKFIISLERPTMILLIYRDWQALCLNIIQ
jgi:hypothetical protein